LGARSSDKSQKVQDIFVDIVYFKAWKYLTKFAFCGAEIFRREFRNFDIVDLIEK